MRSLILILALLVVASPSIVAQSEGKEKRSTECKAGNPQNEKDPSLIDEMGRFLTALKSAVGKGDKTRVALMMHYPLSFSTAETKFTIWSEQEFLSKYDQILTAPIRNLLLRQETRCISRVGAKGFTIGTGEIWFDKFPDGKVKIFAVTAVVYPDE